MEKSGQRITYTKVIDKPALKSPFRYLVEGSVTLFLWSLWAYWISPLVTALLWFLGIQLFQQELITKAGIEEFLGMLRTGGLLVLLITLLMVSWIYYNYLWFLKRGERRGNTAVIADDEKLARIARVDLNLMRKAQGHNRIEVEIRNGQTFILPKNLG